MQQRNRQPKDDVRKCDSLQRWTKQETLLLDRNSGPPASCHGGVNYKESEFLRVISLNVHSCLVKERSVCFGGHLSEFKMTSVRLYVWLMCSLLWFVLNYFPIYYLPLNTICISILLMLLSVWSAIILEIRITKIKWTIKLDYGNHGTGLDIDRVHPFMKLL